MAASWPKGLVLGPLVEYLIQDRCSKLKSDIVAQRMHYKFKQGCYGRFNAEYLAHFPASVGHEPHSSLPLNDEHRESLTADYALPPQTYPESDVEDLTLSFSRLTV